VTISHTEFDGVTHYSHSCNNGHYWTIIIGGNGDRITMFGNWLYDVSGRAPKISSSTGSQTVHAVSNYFSSGTGHNFDISSSGRALIEGNVFENCNTPLTSASNGQIYNTPSYTNEAYCSPYLGRNCEMNVLTNSAWSSRLDNGALSAFSSQKQYLVTPNEVTTVAASVKANAGIGKIGN
jgi:pectin lyase